MAGGSEWRKRTGKDFTKKVTVELKHEHWEEILQTGLGLKVIPGENKSYVQNYGHQNSMAHLLNHVNSVWLLHKMCVNAVGAGGEEVGEAGHEMPAAS